MGFPSTGVFSSHELGVAAPKLGSAVAAMVLAVGLAVRVDRLRRDRARAIEAVLAERAARAEALERLVGGVAHEVGNPLNFIVGGASALASEIPRGNARGVRALGVVQQGAERIRELAPSCGFTGAPGLREASIGIRARVACSRTLRSWGRASSTPARSRACVPSWSLTTIRSTTAPGSRRP
jgi:signal transduction histidine kinase